MIITELEVENIKRLKAIRLNLDGSPIVILKGRNGSGKTSALDSIWYALAGLDAQPEEPVRHGEQQALVRVGLGEPGCEADLVVTRKWQNGKQTLEVRSKDGTKFSSPQKMLDALIGKLSFDPLEFALLTKTPAGRREQAETLKRIVGLDFSANEKEADEAFTRRTDVNRELKKLEAQLEGTPVVNAPDELVSTDDLLAEQELLLDTRQDQEETRAAFTRASDAVDAAKRQAADRRGRVEELRRQLAEAEAAATEAERERARCEEERARASLAVPPDEVIAELKASLEGIRQRIAEVGAVNERVAKRRARAELVNKVAATKAESEALTKTIDSLAAARQKAVEAAEFPVPGLGFTKDGVSLDGVQLNQASKAQQVRLSIAVGLALNPTLRVLLIRDANVLDDEAMKVVGQMAEEAHAQVWLERVGRGDAVGVLIEDGEVVEIHRPEA